MAQSTTITDITGRLSRISSLYQECTAQIDRLAKTSGIGTEVARQELATTIHQSLKEAETELEAVSISISDLPTTPTKLDPSVISSSPKPLASAVPSLQATHEQLKNDIKNARIRYRKAQLSAKRDSEAQKRQMLFGDNGERRRPGAASRKGDLTGEGVVADAANDVTIALQRTHALMEAELSKSAFVQETLAQSTATLKQLNTTYSTFDTLMLKSRDAITDLVKKNKSDYWYMWWSVYILSGTVTWLIIHRWFWGPTAWLLWSTLTPLKLIWWGVSLTGGVLFGAHTEDRLTRDKFVANMIADARPGWEAGEAAKVVKEMEAKQAARKPSATQEPKVITTGDGVRVEIKLDPMDLGKDRVVVGEGEGETIVVVGDEEDHPIPSLEISDKTPPGFESVQVHNEL